MDAESLALAAVAAIRVRELAPTAHMYGALSRLHSPFFKARYIHRTPRGVRFDHRLALGAVSCRRGLDILRHRFPSEYANDFGFRAIARRNSSHHKSARYAGAHLHSVLSHGRSDADCVRYVENTCRIHIPFSRYGNDILHADRRRALLRRHSRGSVGGRGGDPRQRIAYPNDESSRGGLESDLTDLHNALPPWKQQINSNSILRRRFSFTLDTKSLLYISFFASGISAIIYQLVWQRDLFRLFGVNIESVTAV